MALGARALDLRWYMEDRVIVSKHCYSTLSSLKLMNCVVYFIKLLKQLIWEKGH